MPIDLQPMARCCLLVACLLLLLLLLLQRVYGEEGGVMYLYVVKVV